MKKWIKTFAVGTAALVLSACGGPSGKEYVGEWQSVKYAEMRAVIEQNGDSYLVKLTEFRRPGSKKTDTVTLPAVYENGALQVTRGSNRMSVTHVKETDTLVWPTLTSSQEYRRVK